MDAGWCWQIEHEDRVNRGYVYSSSFISDEDAEREFRAANPKLAEVRVVRFVTGRYARAWVKNVVAIGNASGFVEPLEATALGVIGTQSRLLAEALIDAGLHTRPTHAAEYNDHHARCWDGIRSFIAVHYKFNTRRDTPFWRACRADTDLAGAARPVAFFQENGPSGYWAPTMFDPFDAFGAAGYATLLVGMRVSYTGKHTASEGERKYMEVRRRGNQELARRAMGVREALDVIRSPRWRWVGA
jgi:tryptophan halogenase